MKTCKDCNITKDLDSFYSNKTYPDGLESRCKDCKKDSRLHRASKKPSKRKLTAARSRKWRKAEKIMLRRKKLRAEINKYNKEAMDWTLKGDVFEASIAVKMRDKTRTKLKMLEEFGIE